MTQQGYNEQLAKKEAIRFYTDHKTAEDYDVFVSMGSYYHDDNDFLIKESYQGWDYESVSSLITKKYEGALALIQEAFEFTAEETQNLEMENRNMGDFLEKQMGFLQDNVTDIANGNSSLYRVSVVSNENLKKLSYFTKIEEAQEFYIEHCEEHYFQDALARYVEENDFVFSLEEKVALYDGFVHSEEYLDNSAGVLVELKTMHEPKREGLFAKIEAEQNCNLKV